jgi:hypothetical protein
MECRDLRETEVTQETMEQEDQLVTASKAPRVLRALRVAWASKDSLEILGIMDHSGMPEIPASQAFRVTEDLKGLVVTLDPMVREDQMASRVLKENQGRPFQGR